MSSAIAALKEEGMGMLRRVLDDLGVMSSGGRPGIG